MALKDLLSLLESVDNQKLEKSLGVIFDFQQTPDERYAAALSITEEEARLIYSQTNLIRWVHRNIDYLPIRVAAVLSFRLSNVHRSLEAVNIASSLGGNIGEGRSSWRGNFAPRDRMLLK